MNESSQNTGAKPPVLPATDLAGAVTQLMAGRTDAAFLLDRQGRVLAESPAAGLLRAQTPVILRVLAGHAAAAPKRSAVHTLPGMGLRFSVAVCAPGMTGSPLLVSVSRLDQGPHRPVTMRQRQLLAFVRAGLRNAEIAERMQIRPSTVKTMLERLYRLVGVPNRQALARWAGENRIN
ncbi:MAG: hypothetical protein KIT81_00180 [Alphaproteobacteria bacterium]|nr:hypothetical protein [Alphaproteobacteria bacterium]